MYKKISISKFLRVEIRALNVYSSFSGQYNFMTERLKI